MHVVFMKQCPRYILAHANAAHAAWKRLHFPAMPSVPVLLSISSASITAASHLSEHACCFAGPALSQLPLANKPGWLRQRAPQGERYDYLSGSLRSLKLHTVCEEAQCPNVGECWNTGSGTATIMLLGMTAPIHQPEQALPAVNVHAGVLLQQEVGTPCNIMLRILACTPLSSLETTDKAFHLLLGMALRCLPCLAWGFRPHCTPACSYILSRREIFGVI